MRKVLAALLLPVFFLTVLVFGLYFFARLGVTVAVHKIKLRNSRKRTSEKPAKNPVIS